MENNYLQQNLKTFLSAKGRLLFFFLTLISITFNSNAQVVNVTTPGTGTFTVPTGVTSITVSIWGAGGGGGGCNSNRDGGSGGGGGGATTRVIAVTAGNVFNYTIGTGGLGGLATAGLGANGENTSVTNAGLGINMTANGGTGGGPNRGIIGIGGASSGGTTNVSGLNGTIGDTTGQAGGNSGTVISIFGAGGAAVSNSVGSIGALPGGGGGGGERNNGGGASRAGGRGGNGQIRITFACPTYTANAGIDQTIAVCATTATLAGSAVPAGTTGTWTLVSGAATITNPSLANTGVTGLVPGTPTSLRWTISNGSCGSSSDDMVINTSTNASCLPYCIPNYATSVDPITNVTFAGINNTTSNVVNGTPAHQIFLSPTATVEQGETYDISISGNTIGNNIYGIRVFFDWNRDGDFVDAGESFDLGGLNNSTDGNSVYASITVPLTATAGTTRMRVTFMRNAYSTSCQTGAQRGQAEDYLVNILTASCLRPTAVTSAAITATTATISWTAPATAPSSGYDYYISTLNIAPNTTTYPMTAPTGSVAAGVTSVNLTALNPGMTYYVWVRGKCTGTDTSVWTIAINFTTTLSNNDCPGITLTVNTGPSCVVATEGTTSAAATQTLAGCSGNANDDVWYNFVATSASHTVTVVPGTMVDPVFQVFRTNCTAANSIICVDATTTTETTTLTGLTPGATYWVRVYAYGAGATGRGTFTICVTTGTPTYCQPTSEVSNLYIHDYSTTGPMTNTVNLNTGRSVTGYKDYTALTAATQVQNGGVNIDVYLAQSRQYLKAWVDWNNNGTFTDSGTELVYDCAGVQSIATSFGFVIPAGTAPGNYRIRVRSNSILYPFPPCGFLEDGETEDYTLTVISDCSAKITSVTDGSRCNTGTVNLTAVARGTPSQYRWYSAEIGGSLVGTSTSGSWTTPSITATTSYWVTAYNGCESLLRTKVIATINPTANIFVSPASPEICGENNIISVTAAGDYIVEDLVNEKFESGLGTLTASIIGGAGDALTQWQKKTSPFVPVGSVWKPAINSRDIGNGFAYTTSDYNLDVNVALQTATFDTTPFTDLTLSFRQYYSYYGFPYDGAYVEASTDGATWTQVSKYTSDQGIASVFQTVTLDLSAYINYPTLTIRFRYNAKFCDGWAIDDVRLYGNKPLDTTFSWSGAAVDAFIDGDCTIPYVSQTVSTVFVKPNAAQLDLPDWSFTANATLFNGCPISKPINVTNKTRTWRGVSSDWNDNNNWKPALKPTASDCIVIPNTTSMLPAVISGSSYDAFGKNITVKPGGVLTVNSDNNITISNEVTVGSTGIFDIKNSASLIQTNNSSLNTGSIKMTRTSRPMRRWSYVYAGSPIAEDAFGQLPSQFDAKYKWTSGTMNGGWVGLTAVTSGEGFIARVKNIAPFSTGTGTIDFVYNGTPKNGVVTVTVDSYDSSSLVPGNTVLLANPYPSAIDAKKFLEFNNPTIGSNTELGGTLFFWTSVTLYSGTGQYDVADYGSWNLSGGVGNCPVNDPANLSLKPNGKIAAGQGFFAQVFADGQIHFDNSMRVADFNSQFFKNAVTTNNQSGEKNRIWLNLSGTNTFRQMLIGYIDGATDGQDRLYDGDSFSNNEINIYSLLDDRKLVIQGKALPFNENDVVPLGYKITNPGIYSISIDELDGIFSGNQNVYLRDKLLQTDHDLKAAAYTFTATAGSVDNRFELVYVSNALGTDNPNGATATFATISNSILKIESTELIKAIRLYDITGKLINEYSLKESTKQFADTFNYPNGVYIAKITLDNDLVVDKKLIH